MMVIQLLHHVRLLRPHGLQPVRLLCPWGFPGKNTRVGCHFLFQGIFLTQELNLGLLHCKWILYQLSYEGSPKLTYKLGTFQKFIHLLLLLLLSHFSRVRLCAAPQTAAHQASPSLGFSRQEHWSGLPFPSPMHESEKLK